MISDPIVAALTAALAFALGWVLINILNNTSRGFRRGYRKLKCKCGFHEPSGHFVPAIGGRDIMRCLYCDVVVYEVKRSKESIKRTT